MALKKTVEFPLFDQRIPVDVDMRFIEIVERVYDANVDVVAAVILANSDTVKLTNLATVVVEVLGPGRINSMELKRRDVIAEVYGSSSDDLRVIVGSIQAACLYCRRIINDEEFDKLKAGEDLEDDEPPKDQGRETGTEAESTKTSTGS